MIYLRSDSSYDYYYDTNICKYVQFAKFRMYSRTYYDYSLNRFIETIVHRSSRDVLTEYIFFSIEENRNHIATFESILLEKIINNL